MIDTPSPSAFSVCHGHSCAEISTLHLDSIQWQQVRALFEPQPRQPEDERDQIRRAIALLEQLVGTMTGTSGDLGGNWRGFGSPGQLDCIDESSNTTVYLRMLAQDGLLHWHRPGTTVTRGWLLFGWPHTTATLTERQTRMRYAVDSWFLDNGKPPFILPLSQWKGGWRPDTGG